MRFRTLTPALLLAASAFTPAMGATLTASAFDHAVAAGQTTFDLSLDGTTHHIGRLDRVDIEIEGPDGAAGAMFTAHADGRPATIVRLGQDIDLTFDDETTARDPGAAVSGMARRMPAHAANDVLPGAENGDDAARDDGRPGEGLNVYVFLHENARERDHAKFLNWYLTWWFSEMKRHIVPGKHVRVFLKDAVPGLTDMKMNDGTMNDHLNWVRLRAVDHLRHREGDLPGMSRFILVVGPVPSSWLSGALGAAFGRAAIVSNTANRHVVAHELGHTLGATHADSKMFPCASSMADNYFGILSCRAYTEKNRQNIRNYLKDRL